MKLENNTKNFVVGIVLYNEDKKFKDKINMLIDNNYLVYIYDNSPDSKYTRNYLSNKTNESIRYYTSGQNVGLGVAMSTISAQAYYHDFDFMFFLDQDTTISANTLLFINSLKKCIDINRYTALSISNDGINDITIAHNNSNIEIKDVLLIRNSGSLFNLKNLKKINWFDVSYFVDGVDYEFSLRSNIYGYKVGLIKNVPGFDHISEQGYSQYSLLGLKIFNREYGVNRIKDIFKSSIRLILKSIINRKFNFLYVLTKNTSVFFIIQFIIKISKKEKNE
jgi:rhamnosyltransferase